ncbi:Ribonuclease [compost metagenome]
MATLHFLGAAGAVTGSKFLLTTPWAKVLIDCGLFQGPRELKSLNWQPFPVSTPRIDAVILSHAHLDHSGYLPKLIKDGYKGKVFCTSGTADLLSILLPDAGFLQEEEAQHANRNGWSRHRPAMALFTMLDAQRALQRLRSAPYGKPRKVAEGITVTFHPAGHIIGSSIVEIEVEEPEGKSRYVFSGDLGRPGSPLLKDPARLAKADYLIVESTYGDRQHPDVPPAQELARVVNESVLRGGMLVIPAFAVGRTQEVLYVLRELEDQGRIPSLDVYLDSPMAIDATSIALDHAEEFDAEAEALLRRGVKPLAPRKLHLVRDSGQSRALNDLAGPGIILSASGMCTGGRIKHHLRQRLSNERNTVCFVGFQAAGTKGRAILDGASEVWLHGERLPVRAVIERIEGFSAHADQRHLLDWMRGFEAPPRRTFVVHGEPDSSLALAERIQDDLGWKTTVPVQGELIALVATGKARQARV